MLTEKYRPKRIREIIGQGDALRKLALCIQEKRPVLVYGPSGTGKTASILAMANELNYDVIELNSSDLRNKSRINEIVGSSIMHHSLFSGSKIILIDELEGISGQKDRGCLTEISRLLGGSTFPVIMICDKINSKISALARKAHTVEFNKVDSALIFAFLKKICYNEKLNVGDLMLKNIANGCRGDVRAALNDLDSNNASSREREERIEDSLRLIFKSKSANSVLGAFDNVEQDLDECIMWMDENLPKEYSKEDLHRAFDCLSKADIFRKRISRWQYYRFLSYMSALLTAGIAASKENVNQKNIVYKRSARILKLWIAKQRNIKKKEFAGELSKKCHCSVRKIMREMPYLDIIKKSNGHHDIGF